jgi:hypothetical protein
MNSKRFINIQHHTILTKAGERRRLPSLLTFGNKASNIFIFKAIAKARESVWDIPAFGASATFTPPLT